MLTALKFIQGGIAKKDFTNQGLTHVRIEGGCIYAYNGLLSIQHPIPEVGDLQASPKGDAFLRAIRHCDEEVSLSCTASGKLVVKSGRYRTYIEQVPYTGKLLTPPPESNSFIQLAPGFIEALRLLRPFISLDASKKWACSIKMTPTHLMATNNIIAIRKEYETGIPFDIIIPEGTVDELVRIGEPVEWMQVTGNIITFWYGKDRWVCSLTMDLKWPDFDRLFNREHNQRVVPEDFFEVMKKLIAMSDGQSIYFEDNKLALANVATQILAEADFPGIKKGPIFHIDHLPRLEGLINSIDFYAYPSPSRFIGNGLDGLIVGMRE